MRAALATALLVPASAVSAQSGRVDVTTEENFRREPQGQVLARIQAGSSLERLGASGSWTEAALEGWVWTASLQATSREGFDLVVSASGGENLRASPSGQVLARLEEGTLLEELDREPGWTRVRRAGWIWSASVRALETEASSSSGPADAGVTGGPVGGSARTPPSTPPPASAQERFARLGADTPILSAPGGDTVGRAEAGTDVEMVSRDGHWVRVRVEGWAWMPEGEESEGAAEGGDPLTPDVLLAEGGEAHVGRGVVWTLQFISLERAEAVRTDFFEGEPFLLGRYGSSDGPFVYVAVPPARMQEVEGLIPLETVTVTGRVRTAASALTDTPILDLVDIRRGGGR